jgi:hypothetical protein
MKINNESNCIFTRRPKLFTKAHPSGDSNPLSPVLEEYTMTGEPLSGVQYLHHYLISLKFFKELALEKFVRPLIVKFQQWMTRFYGKLAIFRPVEVVSEDRGFESRQGVRFLDFVHCTAIR